MKIRDWFHAADFLLPRDTATGIHCIGECVPKCHCRHGGEKNHSFSTRKRIAVEGGYVD